MATSTYERWLRHQAYADPRILKVQVERSAEAVRSTMFDAPMWAAIVALLASDPVHAFGAVPLSSCFAFLAIVTLSSLVGYFVLRRCHTRQGVVNSARAAFQWSIRLLVLQAFMSTAWGLGAWLLWDPESIVNHIFLGLGSLGVIARFLVTRAGQFDLFVASFVPIAALLFSRYLVDPTPASLILALLLAGYAVRLALDGLLLRKRADQDAFLRFANEDMARDLEDARDEALKKRFEAETANASKTAFLANMSHELRTPLNAILGFSEIIARECLGAVGSARYKEYAGDIHNSGAHLLSLINDLLDVAKIEAGRMEIEPHMIETRQALDDALKLVSVRARERNQTLTIEVEESAAVLYADERAFKQIAINLVSNSVKFTPDGGRITVHAGKLKSGEFELMIADNGAGIPKEKMSRIFLPFSQLDNRYDRQSGGTGLGLALVRGLADLHGGRAWVESEEGKGTRVHVLFPPPQKADTPQRAMA